MTAQRESCPYQKQERAFDFARDKVYEGPVMCDLVDKPCLLESGDECDTYEEYLQELATEE